MRPRQQALFDTLLPELRLDVDRPFPSLNALFQDGVEDLWLEIGFGGAEHLLWQAGQNRNTGLIGCEPFVNGMAKALAGISDNALKNIRLHDDDARTVLDWLPASSIGRVFLLFPDPWPKKRHNKRRFVTPANLERLARVMRAGSELRIGSDIPGHTDWILRHIAACGHFEWTARCAQDWRGRPADWPETRYEAKAVKAGRKPAYLTFMRVGAGSAPARSP